MKRLPLLTAFCSLIPAHGRPRGRGSERKLSKQVQQVLAVAKEVQAQQVAIAENQAKIDAKLATIAESVRVARIFATRGGRK